MNISRSQEPDFPKIVGRNVKDILSKDSILGSDSGNKELVVSRGEQEKSEEIIKDLSEKIHSKFSEEVEEEFFEKVEVDKKKKQEIKSFFHTPSKSDTVKQLNKATVKLFNLSYKRKALLFLQIATAGMSSLVLILYSIKTVIPSNIIYRFKGIIEKVLKYSSYVMAGVNLAVMAQGIFSIVKLARSKEKDKLKIVRAMISFSSSLVDTTWSVLGVVALHAKSIAQYLPIAEILSGSLMVSGAVLELYSAIKKGDKRAMIFAGLNIISGALYVISGVAKLTPHGAPIAYAISLSLAACSVVSLMNTVFSVKSTPSNKEVLSILSKSMESVGEIAEKSIGAKKKAFRALKKEIEESSEMEDFSKELNKMFEEEEGQDQSLKSKIKFLKAVVLKNSIGKWCETVTKSEKN